MAFSKQQVYFQTAGGSKKSRNHTGLAAKDVRGSASITTTAQNTSFKSFQPGPGSGGEDKSVRHRDQLQRAPECEGCKHLSGFSRVSVPEKGYSWEEWGGPWRLPLASPPPHTHTHCQPSPGSRSSLSASSRQLRCIAYSCSRVSGSEAVKRCSSSDFIHSWYLQGQRGGLQQAGLTQGHWA